MESGHRPQFPNPTVSVRLAHRHFSGANKEFFGGKYRIKVLDSPDEDFPKLTGRNPAPSANSILVFPFLFRYLSSHPIFQRKDALRAEGLTLGLKAISPR